MKAFLTLAALFLGLMFSACSYLEKKTDKDPFHLNGISQASQEEAQELILSLKKINEDLITFKGVGSIDLQNKKQTLNSRLMWIGDGPQKLRLELVGIHGQPILRLASDGQWFYIYSLSDKKYYKRRIKDNTLEQFLSIPIRLSTITEMLMGRVPIPDHRYAALIKNPPGHGYLLYVLEQKSGHIVKIFLNEEKKGVFLIEYTDSRGSLLYRINFSDEQRIKSYDIPFSISISDSSGDGIKINVDRFWADIDVNPSVFVLTPPG